MAHRARLRILIADDYAPIMIALERIVSLDHEVVGQVADGASLLAETERLRPDVVLLDLNLQNVNSLQACAVIRHTTPATKVIVLTGAVDPDLRQDVLAAGASAFLGKAGSPGDLLTAIADSQRP